MDHRNRVAYPCCHCHQPCYRDLLLAPCRRPGRDHVCEVCGKIESLTSAQAYGTGWDYPPQVGAWGVVSPRTYERCGMDATVWWTMNAGKKTVDDLTPEQMETVARMLNEMPD